MIAFFFQADGNYDNMAEGGRGKNEGGRGKKLTSYEGDVHGNEETQTQSQSHRGASRDSNSNSNSKAKHNRKQNKGKGKGKEQQNARNQNEPMATYASASATPERDVSPDEEIEAAYGDAEGNHRGDDAEYVKDQGYLDVKANDDDNSLHTDSQPTSDNDSDNGKDVGTNGYQDLGPVNTAPPLPPANSPQAHPVANPTYQGMYAVHARCVTPRLLMIHDLRVYGVSACVGACLVFVCVVVLRRVTSALSPPSRASNTYKHTYIHT